MKQNIEIKAVVNLTDEEQEIIKNTSNEKLKEITDDMKKGTIEMFKKEVDGEITFDVLEINIEK